MKQILRQLLLMLICGINLPVAKAETIVTVGKLQYSLSGLYASVYGVAEGVEEVDIPSSVHVGGFDYTITSIADGAFAIGWIYDGNDMIRVGGRREVKKVTVPATVTSIGFAAFDSSNLEDITLSEGVTSIGGSAFRRTKLREIVIPSSVSYIGGKSSNYYLNYSPSYDISIFDGCNYLRTIYYLGKTPPTNWTATSQTFVPNKAIYSNPKWAINTATIIEMITFSDTRFTYSGKTPAVTWTNNLTAYSADFIMPELRSDVGSYEEDIPVTFTNYEKTFTSHILYKYTISPAKLFAKVNNKARTYGEPNPIFDILYSGFVNGENESVFITKPTATANASPTSSVGSYAITASGGRAKNYIIEYTAGELIVNKASLEIQVKDAQKVYGSNNPAFMLNFYGLKNHEAAPEWILVPQFNTTATRESNTGTYAVNVTCEPRNYIITTNTPGKLHIVKAPLSIKVEDAEMLYCGAPPTYAFSYTGFVNGDNASSLSALPKVSTIVTPNSNAGNYTISASGAVSSNYDIAYVPGTLTIKQRELKVSVLSATRLYGDNNPVFTIKYDGFVNNETKGVLDVEPIASTTATALSSTGTYDVMVSGGRAANYNLVYQSGQLIITPRHLKASVGIYKRPYGENNPVFTILYDGFVGNDTEYSLKPSPIARTSATRLSEVGTYDIEVTGGYSPNYILSYGSGKLSVVEAEQLLEWNQDLYDLKVGDQVVLSASASSGLPITYQASSDNYADLYMAGNKTFMECKYPGSFVIKAIQKGNKNYYPTQYINKNVTIVNTDEFKPSLFIKQANSGLIGLKVEKGSKNTFSIYSEPGWKIYLIMYNGEDVTNQLDSNNSYTTPPINNNSTLVVVYEQGNNAIHAQHSPKVKILPTEKGVKVIGLNREDVIRVYNVDGTIQNTVRAFGTEMEIPLENSRVYIVKVGELTVKFRK